MDRRTLAAGVALLAALAGVALLGGTSPGAFLGTVAAGIGVAAVALAGLAALVAVALRYRRWRAYHGAIHVAALLVAFAAGTAWWLGPAGVGEATPLDAREVTVVRTAALALLLGVVLALARSLDRDGP